MLSHCSLVFHCVTVSVLFPFPGPQWVLEAKLRFSILSLPGNIMQASCLASCPFGILAQTLQDPSFRFALLPAEAQSQSMKVSIHLHSLLFIIVYAWEDAPQEKCLSRCSKQEGWGWGGWPDFQSQKLLTEAQWRWEIHCNFPCLKYWMAFQRPWDKDPKPSQHA